MKALATLDQLAVEIRFYSQQTAQSIIEVGKRLVEAKKQVPHGEWGKWLETQVSFTERTARRFMQCAERFGKASTSTLLSLSQMTEILALPDAETEDFIKAKDAEGTPVESMTVKALREEVSQWKTRANDHERERLRAEQEAQSLQSQLQSARESGNAEEVARLQKELDEAKEVAQFAADRAEGAESALEESMNENDKLQSEKEELAARYAELKKQKKMILEPADYQSTKRALAEMEEEEMKELQSRPNVTQLSEEDAEALKEQQRQSIQLVQFLDAAMNLPEGKELEATFLRYLHAHLEIDAAMMGRLAGIIEEVARAYSRDIQKAAGRD